MKRLKLPLAAAGLLVLTGCVGYGGGTYGSGGVYYDNSPYYGSSYYGTPYGSAYYGYGAGVVVERPTYVYGGRTYYRDRDRGTRDRDHDGVPNRYDRDRDGDGVSNRRDAYPNNPRHR